MPLPTQLEVLIDQAFSMSPADQFTLAERVAANVGYNLVPDGHSAEATLTARVDRLEQAVHELNPGWMP